MRPLNWFSPSFEAANGYGHWNLQFVRALLLAGVEVHPRSRAESGKNTG